MSRSILLFTLIAVALGTTQQIPKEPLLSIFYDTSPSSEIFLTRICQNNEFVKMLQKEITVELVPSGNCRHQFNTKLRVYIFYSDGRDRLCRSIRHHACFLHDTAENTTIAGRNVSSDTLLRMCELFQLKERIDDERDGRCNTTFANFGTRTERVKPSIATFPSCVFNDNYNETESQKIVEDAKFPEYLKSLINQLTEGQDRFVGNAGNDHFFEYRILVLVFIISAYFF